MAFKVSKSEKPKHKNKFIITSTWMSGDADSYNNISKSFPKNKQKAAEEYAEFVSSLEDVNGEDMSDEILWERIQPYNSLLKELEIFHDEARSEKLNETDREEQLMDVIFDYVDIPPDVTSDGQWSAKFDSIEVTFYDENGLERAVKVS